MISGLLLTSSGPRQYLPYLLPLCVAIVVICSSGLEGFHLMSVTRPRCSGARHRSPVIVVQLPGLWG